MKRILFIALALCLVSSLFAQSLLDNPDYKKSLEYKALSEQAAQEGDYLKAIEYANLSTEHAERSNVYVGTMVDRFRANSSLNLLRNRLAEVKRFGGEETHYDEYTEASEGYILASDLFTEAKYPESRSESTKALEILATIVPVRDRLPAAYKVRLIPENRDCLWNIAGYPFVYGDPTLWPRLYEANKSRMPQPDNPNLIHPDMILTIPERSGESRSGTWTDGEIK